MAGRIVNRRELRKQAETAETLADAPSTDAPDAQAAPAKKAKKAPAPRKPRVPKVKVPPRMRARWCIFDGGMKQVAIFDYNQRADADAKLAELLAKAKTSHSHFLQIVKEPMPEPAVPVAPAG
jgi:hypothetical protein